MMRVLFFCIGFCGLYATLSAQPSTDKRRTFSYTDDSTVMPGDVHVHRILFDFNGNCRYYPEYEDSLAVISEYLLKHPNIRVLITDHVDTRGNAEANQKLSECRARSLARYFKARNVPERQYILEGCGEWEPLVSQETIDAEPDEIIEEAYQRMNRRVEVKILSVSLGVDGLSDGSLSKKTGR